MKKLVLFVLALVFSKFSSYAQVKPYADVIPVNAKTFKGLFTVHQSADKCIFEIPDSLLGRDLLIVCRIAKAPAMVNRPISAVTAGEQVNSRIINFEKGPNNRLFLKTLVASEISQDSSENGMYHNVKKSNLQPIASTFEIKALKVNGIHTSYVIDLTEYINGDNDLFFFSDIYRENTKLGALQSDRSYIESVHAYPQNIAISTFKSYSVSGKPNISSESYGLYTSIILLPKTLMPGRTYDDRVGFIPVGFPDLNDTVLDFDKNPQGIAKITLIRRFRLEPKKEDIKNYLKGELVEPQKQIVFYVDGTTPKKWIPYIIQGVNDWEPVFRKAGFKNAIIGREAPINNPEFAIEDARYNTITYMPSELRNATGGSICDPRTGEVLEGYINWYHNILSNLQEFYMVQAGATDPRARKLPLDDALMGRIIRSVISHEVGHTLGLHHNMGASSMVPVEKLRDKDWLKKNGTTTSIMEYSRFNYVAQPEDDIDQADNVQRIGDYDSWAIQWGYRWLPETMDQKSKASYLNKLIIDSLNANPRLWYGSQDDSLNPRCQTEDLGNNAMKASVYGIKNLQRTIPFLREWTETENEDFGRLKEMYEASIKQFSAYMDHVTKNIGGVYTNAKTLDHQGPIYQFVPKNIQKEAIEFLNTELFKTPLWLVNTPYKQLIDEDPLTIIIKLQVAQLDRIFDPGVAYRFLKFEAQPGPETAIYILPEMWCDVKKGVWQELKSGEAIDIYRKSLQKAYIEKLISLISQRSVRTDEVRLSELQGLARQHGVELLTEIKTAIPKSADVRTRIHLLDIINRLELALVGSKKAE